MTVAITRGDLTSADLRKEAARTQDAKAARRMLAMALVLEGHSREAAAESCGMSATVWYAGAVSICSSGFGESWRCRCTSARSARCYANWRSGGCRCDRSIHRAGPRHKCFSNRVCRSRDRRAAARDRGQAGGNLVYRWLSAGGDQPCWSAGYVDAGLGKARLASPRPTRPPLRVGLLVRSDLPGAQHWCRGDHALGQYRSNERASSRDQPMRLGGRSPCWCSTDDRGLRFRCR